jgi:hypothetical protein
MTPSRKIRRSLRGTTDVHGPGQGTSIPDGAKAKEDDVAHADHLHDREERLRALDDRADADRDRGSLHQLSGRVAGHRGQPRATAERNRPADLEQHARAGDHDQDERRRREAEETIRRNHRGSLRPGWSGTNRAR